jgi:hypothetical protein
MATSVAELGRGRDSIDETCPLVREGTPHQQTQNCLKIIKKREELVVGTRLVPDTKRDWPTDRRSLYDVDFVLDNRRVSYWTELQK